MRVINQILSTWHHLNYLFRQTESSQFLRPDSLTFFFRLENIKIINFVNKQNGTKLSESLNLNNQ